MPTVSPAARSLKKSFLTRYCGSHFVMGTKELTTRFTFEPKIHTFIQVYYNFGVTMV